MATLVSPSRTGAHSGRRDRDLGVAFLYQSVPGLLPTSGRHLRHRRQLEIHPENEYTAYSLPTVVRVAFLVRGAHPSIPTLARGSCITFLRRGLQIFLSRRVGTDAPLPTRRTFLSGS